MTSVSKDESESPGLDDIPEEELRLALVLNGGVSLAVWMGGVAHEINRLTLAAGGTDADYGPILSAARASATVDVISGTSAGGINGAALALAQANRGADLLGLRTLWAEQGRMEELLRRPFRGKPTSLLRGDEYFLPELGRAMNMLTEPFVARGEGGYTPIDLTLTTTLLTGSQTVTVDDFGEKIPQQIHAGTFQFSNVTMGAASDLDPFGAANVKDTARALALAARCTASFPLAFEPSFVPVGEDGAGDDLHPDMRRFASWADREKPRLKQSKYVVDGGVLANTPLTHALDAISRREIDRPIRRAMLLVFPHAPEAAEVKPDDPACPPSASGSLAGVFGALQAQGSRSYVEQVDDHNRRAADWTGGRRQLLLGFGEKGNSVEKVYQLLGSGWPHYRHVRMGQAAKGLADSVVPTEHWPYSRILGAAQDAQQAWVQHAPGGHQHDLPFVPATFDVTKAAWQRRYLAPSDRWLWGDSGASGVAVAVAEVLRAALSVAGHEHKQLLSDARREVGVRMGRIRTARQRLDAVWTSNDYLRSLAPNRDYWRARVIAYERAMLPRGLKGRFGELEARLFKPDHQHAEARTRALVDLDSLAGVGAELAAAVREVIDQLTACENALQAIAAHPRGADEISGVHSWCQYLFAPAVPGEPAARGEQLMLRLLALDAATRLLTGGVPTGTNVPIKLAELSLRVGHPWAHLSTSPADKAAGLQLARFGGFLKRSWRVNDWIWGRLDAITELCQIVLDPRRLIRMSAMVVDRNNQAATRGFADQIFGRLKQGLYGEAVLPPALEHLEKAAYDELCAALEPDQDEPLHLPKLAAWAALPLQAEVMLEELPALAAAVSLDVDDGAGKPTRGTRFLVDRADLLTRVAKEAAEPPDAVTSPTRFALGCEALRAFDGAGIGRETLAEETGSNALIRTASNAAGVLATVLDTDAARMPAAKPVTSAVRGAMMLPHWVVNGLAGGGRVARFLATVGLIVGGLFLVLSLFGVLGNLAAAAGLVGAATLLAAMAYSALKTGSLLHACALLAPVVPLVAYAVTKTEGTPDAGSRVLVVVAAVTALYILANIPWPLTSPFAWVGSLLGRSQNKPAAATKPRWRPRVVLTVTVGVVVLAAITVGLALPWSRERLGDAWQWCVDLLADNWDVQAGAIALVVVAGGALAYREGALLRTWRSNLDADTTYQKRHLVTGSFERHNVQQPSGVAASWAPVYGTGYLLLAWGAWHLATTTGGRETWEVFTVWWLAAIGAVLCLLAPILVARRPRRRLRQLLGRSWQQVQDRSKAGLDAGADGRHIAPREDDNDQQLLYALLKYDATFCYLTRAHWPDGQTSTDASGRDPEHQKASQLELTAKGRKLEAQLMNDAEAAQARQLAL
jgi:patatin-related protein